MKCFYHPEIDITATCIDCNKGLCVQCSKKYEQPICNECNSRRLISDKKVIVKNIILMVISYIAGVLFIWKVLNGQLGSSLLTGFIFAGIPWGWGFLNKITPQMFLFLSLIGWVIYFLIKISLSMVIGVIIMPVKIIQIILATIHAKKVGITIKNESM